MSVRSIAPLLRVINRHGAYSTEQSLANGESSLECRAVIRRGIKMKVHLTQVLVSAGTSDDLDQLGDLQLRSIGGDAAQLFLKRRFVPAHLQLRRLRKIAVN